MSRIKGMEEVLYDTLITYGIATEDELQLVRNLISGDYVDIMNNVLYTRTGYHDLEQYYDCELKYYERNKDIEKVIGWVDEDELEELDEELRAFIDSHPSKLPMKESRVNIRTQLRNRKLRESKLKKKDTKVKRKLVKEDTIGANEQKLNGILSIKDGQELEFQRVGANYGGNAYEFNIKRVDGKPIKAYLDNFYVENNSKQSLNIEDTLEVTVPYFNCAIDLDEYLDTVGRQLELDKVQLEDLPFDITLKGKDRVSYDHPYFDILGELVDIDTDFIDNITVNLDDDIVDEIMQLS